MAQHANWHPPKIAPGDIVYHCPDGKRNTRPYPAIAVRVHERNIHLWTIGGEMVEGARYIDDPDLTSDQVEDFGCWALSETSERLIALEAKVAELEAALATDTRKRTSPTGNIQGKPDGLALSNRGTVARSD